MNPLRPNSQQAALKILRAKWMHLEIVYFLDARLHCLVFHSSIHPCFFKPHLLEIALLLFLWPPLVLRLRVCALRQVGRVCFLLLRAHM